LTRHDRSTSVQPSIDIYIDRTLVIPHKLSLLIKFIYLFLLLLYTGCCCCCFWLRIKCARTIFVSFWDRYTLTTLFFFLFGGNNWRTRDGRKRLRVVVADRKRKRRERRSETSVCWCYYDAISRTEVDTRYPHHHHPVSPEFVLFFSFLVPKKKK
jgi:hypothetical protein